MFDATFPVSNLRVMTWKDRKVTLYNDVKEFVDAARIEV